HSSTAVSRSRQSRKSPKHGRPHAHVETNTKKKDKNGTYVTFNRTPINRNTCRIYHHLARPTSTVTFTSKLTSSQQPNPTHLRSPKSPIVLKSSLGGYFPRRLS
ncbi:unnamed protein product, partial [Ectocarpus sp. 12 AP-2014]